MSAVVPQSKVSPPPMASRRWRAPLRAETLLSLVECANHANGAAAAGQTCATVAHTGDVTTATDPSGVSGLLRFDVPQTSPLCGAVEVVITYQAHGEAGAAGLKVRLVTDAGAALDPAVGGWAQDLTTDNGGIPAGGRVLDDSGVFAYPARRVVLVGARALQLGGSAGQPVALEVEATRCRVLVVWMGEEPRRVV